MEKLVKVKAALEEALDPNQAKFIYELCETISNSDSSEESLISFEKDLKNIVNAKTPALEGASIENYYADNYPDGGGGYQDNEG